MQSAATIQSRDRHQFNMFWLLDHVLGTERVDRVLGSARQQLDARVRAGARGGRVREVEKIADPGAKAFRRDYLSRALPVVLEGAARDWRCCKKWSPAFFQEHYGSREQVLIAHSPLEIHRKKLVHDDIERTSMSDVISQMGSGQKSYANFNPILHYVPELRDDLDLDWLFSHRHRLGVETIYQLFMGGPGTGTGLHSALSCNLFVQIYGEKRWVFYSPELNPALDIAISREPCFHSRIDAFSAEGAQLDRYEVILEPGDVLYNPPFFWHQTENLGDAIGVSFKWSYLPSSIRSSGMQSLLTFLSTNPPIWKVIGGGPNYLNIYTHGRS